MNRVAIRTASAVLTLCAPLAAASAANQAEKTDKAAAKVEQSLHPRTGTIAVPGAHARLNLGDRYVFLDADEARRVLVDAWGNPPDSADGVLGMVLPKGGHIANSWGAVLSYDDTGHVADTDAARQDYDSVLSDMKKSTEESNDNRKKGGFAPVHLIGWAQPPAYDASGRALIWARDIRFEGSSPDTLNYDVRKLARDGVLSMNMIDTMDDLPAIRQAAADLGQTVSFDPGAGYANYNPKTDRAAGYGLAGLVAAGAGLAVAQKVGLLGVVLVFLKKGLVLIAVAIAALRRRIMGWFRKGGTEPADDTSAESPLNG